MEETSECMGHDGFRILVGCVCSRNYDRRGTRLTPLPGRAIALGETDPMSPLVGVQV